MLARFSCATRLPFAFESSDAEQVAAARRKSRNGMRRWRDCMRAFAPEWSVPIAVPLAVLSSVTGRAMRGSDTGFTTPEDLITFLRVEEPDLAESTPLLLPGDTLDLDREEVIEDAEAHAAFSW